MDMVNHPPHYASGKIECIDAIESALGEGFGPYLRGQVIKYLWRAGKKNNEIEDLQKAEFYLRRLIRSIQERNRIS